MRLRVTAPPGREELGARPVHELIRDYPETLAAFLEAGVDPAAVGGGPLADLPDPDGRLRDRILTALAWRRTGAESDS